MATKARRRPPSSANGQPHLRARGAGREGATHGALGGTGGSENWVVVGVGGGGLADGFAVGGGLADGFAVGGAQAAPGGGSTLSATVSPLVAISSTTSTFVTTWALALAAASVVG